MSFTDARVLSPNTTSSPDEVRVALSRIAGFIDNPIADVSITPIASTTTPRKVTLQVRDRLNNPWKARWIVWVMVGPTQWSISASGAQTVVLVTGHALVQVVTGALLRGVTNSSGILEFTIDTTGSVWVTVDVEGRAQSSTEVVISARGTGHGWLFNNNTNSAHILLATWE